MFLSSFEKLREKMMLTETVNMAHLGARAFEEIGGEVVQTTAFVRCINHIDGYKGTYCRLIEPTTQKGKEEMFLAGANRYIANQDNFEIRNYFLNNFFKDHCTTYSVTGSGKGPIYWLFDAGKSNGFKCLIYLHRYTKDTVGLIRADYLIKMQSAIENALKNAEYTINTTTVAVDKARATGQRNKYIKQLGEIKAYYPVLSHIAVQRIDLDLDDGVKVDYAKFQGVEVSVEGEKDKTVDLLWRI